MNRRFTVVRDDPQKCWRIFDTSVNKFTPYKHERQVQAEAEAAELNEMDAKGDVTITAGAVGKLHPKKAAAAAAAAGAPTGRLNDPVPAGETTKKVIGEYSQIEGQPWTRASNDETTTTTVQEKSEHLKKMDRWHEIVLKKLEGKVKCSECDYAYLGARPDGPWAKEFGNHSLKVTRYLGAEDPEAKLMVDLTCNICEHSGMYTFENNPVAPIDILF